MICYALTQSDDASIAYINLTGRFPKQLSRGNKYILGSYYYNANCILDYAIKNCKRVIIIEARNLLHKNSNKLEYYQKPMWISNRGSQDLIRVFEEKIQILVSYAI